MIKKILQLVKLQHSLFAMPFTIAATIMAAQGFPEVEKCLWILLAFVGARSFGMSMNRLIDRHVDAQNPRTAHRLMASGQITPIQLAPFALLFASMLSISAYNLGEWPLKLLPLCLAALIIYPYFKRFSLFAHTFLGFVLGLAPIGAWLAVLDTWHSAPIFLAISIVLWVNGFDIIYAIQDMDFDKKQGLKSVPAYFGKTRSLNIALLLHICVPIFWYLVGLVLNYGAIYFWGTFLLSIILMFEHYMVRKGYRKNIGLVFFKLNSTISLGYLFIVTMQIFL